MPRRHSYRYSSSYDRRYPYAPRSSRRYRRGGDGCLSNIQEFFTSLLRVMVLVGLTIVVLGFVITHFAQTIAFFTTIFRFLSLLISLLPLILHYGLYVAGGLIGLAVPFAVISLLSSISERWAEASAVRAEARQAKLRAKHERVRIEQERVRARQEEVKAQREQVRLERARQDARYQHNRQSMQLAQAASLQQVRLAQQAHAQAAPPAAFRQ